MRVGVVTTSYPRFAGDPAGAFVAEHVDWLRGCGHDVEVVAAGDGAPAHPASGVHRIPAPGLFYRGGAPDVLERERLRYVQGAGFTARMAAAVARRARRWDAVIAHWLAPSALVAALASRAPLVGVAHSAGAQLLARTGGSRIAGPLLAGRGARLVFTSETLRGSFLGGVPAAAAARLAVRSVVTPMGIDVTRLRAARLAAPASAGPRIVFLGRLVAIKGVEILLAAAASAPLREVEVVIAGDGPERSRLQRLAGPNVRFVGEVHGPARDALLASAEVLVMPSRPRPDGRTEGMPVTVLEAMAAGAAVVASATGGLAELPGEVICRVEPGDSRSLAAAVAALLRDPDRRRRQTAAAGAWVERFDWPQVGPLLLPA